MSTGHIVTHIGSCMSARLCWRAGCSREAVETHNKRGYCAEHVEPRPETPTFDHVLVARHLMKPTRGGLDLADVAGRLGLMKSGLDLAIWHNIGRHR